MTKKTEPEVTPEVAQGPDVTTAKQAEAEVAKAAESAKKLVDDLTKTAKTAAEKTYAKAEAGVAKAAESGQELIDDLTKSGKTTAEQADAEAETGAASAAASSQELIDELTKLGKKFVEVLEVAWNSEPRKKAEHELRGGIESVATTVEDGVKRVSNTKEAQGLVNVAEDVAEKVRTSKLATELSNALAEGLRALSAQMDKVASELKKSSAEQDVKPSKTSAEAGDIPITRDNEG